MADLFDIAIAEKLAGGGGGGGGSWTVLTEETVTTTVDPEEPDEAAYADLVYSQLIDAESIKVTFNGTEYECEVNYDGSAYTYGASYDYNLDTWDWSEYPFAIGSHSGSMGVRNGLTTQTAGIYTVKLEAPSGGGGSSDFSTATVTATYGHTIEGAFYAELPQEAPFEGATFHQNSMSDTLILYKGVGIIRINDPVQSISGNIQDMGEGGYIVTGDCTIVFQ